MSEYGLANVWGTSRLVIIGHAKPLDRIQVGVKNERQSFQCPHFFFFFFVSFLFPQNGDLKKIPTGWAQHGSEKEKCNAINQTTCPSSLQCLPRNSKEIRKATKEISGSCRFADTAESPPLFIHCWLWAVGWRLVIGKQYILSALVFERGIQNES